MRLSEAIRLGSMLKPQAREFLHNDGKTCALGSACEAHGIELGDDGDVAVHSLFVQHPWLHQFGKCPACWAMQGWWRRFRNEEYDIEDVIIHLNDDHKWTRERIADWVETIERELSPSAGEARKVDAVRLSPDAEITSNVRS